MECMSDWSNWCNCLFKNAGSYDIVYSECLWTRFVKSVFYLSGTSFLHPSVAMHLSHLRFHWLKHLWKSSSFKPLSNVVVLVVITATSPRCRPRSTNLHLETRKYLRELNLASKVGGPSQWLNCVPNTHAQSSQCARGHCPGEDSTVVPSQTQPHTTHAIPQTLQNLHVESCVDSLTLRYEFVVHNSVTFEEDS
jgi:hypothetical protein